MQLCADGTCADITAGQVCDTEAVSPCSCEALPLVCAKQVDELPNCSERFQPLYDANTECLEVQTESLPQVDFTGPWFMACYIGLSASTLLMLIWCAYNQRWASVEGSTVPLESPAMELNGGVRGSAIIGAKKRYDLNGGDEEDLSKNTEWTQTGYKSTVVGMALYSLIILAFWIIQFLLFALSVEYCELPTGIVNPFHHH
jgi:hypothetical protein